MAVQAMVHTSSRSALASVSAYVARGFTYYTTGTVPYRKAEKFARKMHNRYGVHGGQYDLEKQREKGQARARLVMFEGAEKLHFVLLATEGQGLIHSEESLANAQKDGKLTWGGLVLRRRVTPSEKKRKKGKSSGGDSGSGHKVSKKQKSEWAWYLTKREYQEVRDLCLTAARKKDLRQARIRVGELMKIPGFNGVRHQRKRLFESMLRTARHAGHSESELEFIPRQQGWVRFRKSEVEQLSALIARRSPESC